MTATTVRDDVNDEQESTNTRDARGRFAKGNAGGPGNPFARQVALLRSVMVHCVKPEDMARAVRALTEKAAGGDVAAMKLFFQYLLGKPAESVDPDRIRLDEWQKLKEAAIDSQEAADVLEKVPATMACDHTRTYWPVVIERNMREALEEHAEAEAAAAEDERYLESRSAEEEEALLASVEAGYQNLQTHAQGRQDRDPRPKRQTQDKEPADRKAATRHDESPSANGEMWMEEGGSGWGRLLGPAIAGVREEAINAILNRDRPSPNPAIRVEEHV
jgi:hypothetical protein